MSDDPKNRADPNADPANTDPAHETMPPELRPFAKPVPIQPLVAPENEAAFRAAIDVLRFLNGGPNADPFYVDPKNDPAFADRKAPESVKAYASTALPAVATVRPAAPARVVIANREPPSIISDHAGEVDIRPFQGVRRAARDRARDNAPVALVTPGDDDDVTRDEVTLSMREQPPETPASPWATEAAAEDVRGCALPSSLRPREAPPGEEDAAVASPAPRGWGRAVVFAIVAVATALVVWALARGRPSEGAQAPVPTTGTAAATPISPSAPSAPAEPTPISPIADAPQVSASPAASATPRVKPKRVPKSEDPSAAATARPAVTLAPSTTRPAPPPVPTAHPAAPAASSPPQPPPIPKIIEGTEP